MRRHVSRERLRRAIELGNENKPLFERDKNWDSLLNDQEYQKIIDSIQVPSSGDDGGP